jgi:hypothetical protein
MTPIAMRHFEVTINITPDDPGVRLEEISNFEYECEVSEVGDDGSIHLESAFGGTPAEAARKAFEQLGLSYFEPTSAELDSGW